MPGRAVSLLLLATLTAGPSRAQPALLDPADLEYVGAFAFPAGDDWAYGGHALAWSALGDPSGPDDGHPGSLYGPGNAQADLVGELSIPVPTPSASFSSLPIATELRSLIDPTGGILDALADDCGTCDRASFDVGGLAWLTEPGKLAWNIKDWYNVGAEDLESLGWSDADLGGGTGPWHIGPRPNDTGDRVFHNAKTADYLFHAPAGFAAEHLGGRTLIAGYHRESGALGGSQGPTLYALAPWSDGDPPTPGQDLDALALLYYPWNLACTENDFDQCLFDGYRVDDEWGGGAWVDTGSLTGILIFGRKGLGDNCYGTPGVNCPPDACVVDQGYHSDPYVPQVLFYDPAAIAAVVAGTIDPWTAQPYATWTPTEVFDDACGVFGGVAFDRASGLIYATELAAGEFGEVTVHVWRVSGPLFADGFESGGLGAWSSTTPG